MPEETAKSWMAKLFFLFGFSHDSAVNDFATYFPFRLLISPWVTLKCARGASPSAPLLWYAFYLSPGHRLAVADSRCSCMGCYT